MAGVDKKGFEEDFDVFTFMTKEELAAYVQVDVGNLEVSHLPRRQILDFPFERFKLFLPTSSH